MEYTTATPARLRNGGACQRVDHGDIFSRFCGNYGLRADPPAARTDIFLGRRGACLLRPLDASCLERELHAELHGAGAGIHELRGEKRILPG